MKTKKCQIEFCETRVKQQDWKTEEEKEICFTCLSIIKILTETQSLLKMYFNNRPIQISWKYDNKK